jgi:hypothetical protein
MAWRARAAPAPQLTQLTPEAMRSGIARLKRRVEEVKQLNTESAAYNIAVTRLAASIDDALIRTFGVKTKDYYIYHDAVHLTRGSAIDINYKKNAKTRSIGILEEAIRPELTNGPFL